MMSAYVVRVSKASLGFFEIFVVFGPLLLLAAHQVVSLTRLERQRRARDESVNDDPPPT